MNTNIESLRCTLETDIMLFVNYTSTATKKCFKRWKESCPSQDQDKIFLKRPDIHVRAFPGSQSLTPTQTFVW